MKQSVRRFGEELTIESSLVTHETADGRLLAFEQTTRNPPSSETRLSGRFAGGRVTLTSTVNGVADTTEMPVEPGVRSPLWQERVLGKIDAAADTPMTFRAFLPDLKAVSDVRVTAGGTVDRTLADGMRKRLRAFDVVAAELKQFPFRFFVDGRGEIWASETPFFGRLMRSDRVSAEFALAEGGPAEFDIGNDTLIDVRPLKDPHRLREIVYRVSFPDAFVGDLPPSSSRQRVERIDDRTLRITVTSGGGSPPSRPASGREHLASTQLVQADDFRVRRHADDAIGPLRDPARVADALTGYVGRTLVEKNFSTAMASAAEVAETLSGDCTEHAVLLAAMLRAKRIPSRVAVGFLYLPGRGKLGGHMWTEAFLDGDWKPLDATLGGRPVGPGHIKLADSALSDDAAALTLFLPVLDWSSGVKVDVTTPE